MTDLTTAKAKLAAEFTEQARTRLATFSNNLERISANTLTALESDIAFANKAVTSLTEERDLVVAETKETQELLESIAAQETITQSDLDRVEDHLVANLMKSFN